MCSMQWIPRLKCHNFLPTILFKAVNCLVGTESVLPVIVMIWQRYFFNFTTYIKFITSINIEKNTNNQPKGTRKNGSCIIPLSSIVVGSILKDMKQKNDINTNNPNRFFMVKSNYQNLMRQYFR